MVNNDHEPLVSVCIPAYNAEIFITETINSIIQQSYKNLEIIVNDNCSQDSTWSILESMTKQYSELRRYKNQRNIGMTGNWNKALEYARGQYVMLLSADDKLEVDFIKTAIDIFIHEKTLDIVTFNHKYLRDVGGKQNLKNRKISVKAGVYEDFFPLVILKNPFSINFTIFSSQALHKLKNQQGFIFNRNLLTCDYDLWFRVALQKLQVFYSDKPLGIYRVHNNNLSKNKIKMFRQTFLTWQPYHRELYKNHLLVFKYSVLLLSIKYIYQLLMGKITRDMRFEFLLLGRLFG